MNLEFGWVKIILMNGVQFTKFIKVFPHINFALYNKCSMIIIISILIFQIYKITRRNCKQKEKEISSTDKGILRFFNVKKMS